MRPLAPAACVVALLGAAPAATQDLDLEARAGFGGWYKLGHPLPLQVTIANGGVDREGVLVAGPAASRIALRALLPAPSRSQVSLELPDAPRLEALEVLLDAGELTRTVEAPLVAVPADDILEIWIGTVPGATTSRDAPHDVATTFSAAPARHRITVAPDTLPAGWRGWLGVDRVVASESALATLSAGQVEALSDRIALGGTLVVVRDAVSGRAAAGSGGATPRRQGMGLLIDAHEAELASLVERWDAGGPPPLPASVPLLDLPGQRVDDAFPFRPAPVVALWFSAYLVLLGAVVTAGSRVGRPALTAAGAAVAIAAFTVAAEALPWVATGGSGLLAESSLVHVLGSLPASFVETGGELRAGRRAGPVVLGADLLRPAFTVSGAKVEYRLATNARFAPHIELDLWERISYRVSGFRDTGLAIVDSPAGWILRNDSGLGLEDCHHRRDGALERLPDLPAGATLLLDANGSGRPAASSTEVPVANLVRRLLDDPRSIGGAVACAAGGELPVGLPSGAFSRSSSVRAVVFHLPAPLDGVAIAP